MVALDARRNTNREALGELRRKGLKDAPVVWMNFGDLFLRLPHAQATALVEKDQAKMDSEIAALQDGLKAKARDLAGAPAVSAGFALKGMRPAEFSGPAAP